MTAIVESEGGGSFPPSVSWRTGMDDELIKQIRAKASDPNAKLSAKERDLLMSLTWAAIDELNRKVRPMVFAYQLALGLVSVFSVAGTAFISALVTGKVEVIIK